MASETRFLDAGRRGKFSVTNWGAPTGIGRFDAVYNPQAGQLDVTFKVCVEFRDNDQKWRDDEQLAWPPRAFKIIEDFWSRRYLLQCMRPGWEKYRAAVNVKCVPAAKTDCHVLTSVSKASPLIGTVGGGVGWATTPPGLYIDNLTLEPKDQRKKREAIFNLRLYQIEQGLKDRGLSVIPFEKNSADIPAPMKIKLLDYARYVHRIATKDVSGIEINIYGSKGGSDGTFQSGLGKRRARAVADVFDCVIRDDTAVVATDSASKRPGLKAAVLAALSAAAGKASSSTSYQGVVIVPNVPPDVDRAAEMNYVVICHEFGHMLGLPDEYNGPLHPQLTERVNSDNLISKTLQLSTKSGDPSQWTDPEKRQLGQHEGMAELLRWDTGVKAPTFLNDGKVLNNVSVGTNSIMHSGMEVMPAHYLTLWSCLAEMTWNYINPRDWKIVPSPDNRGGVRYF